MTEVVEEKEKYNGGGRSKNWMKVIKGECVGIISFVLTARCVA